MRVLAAVVVVLVAVAMAQAVSQDFGVVKDTSVDRYLGNSMGNGGAPNPRGAKASWREDLSMHAFDNAAISAFIAANGGAANIQSATLYFSPATFGAPVDGSKGIQVRQLISGNDWAESNGAGGQFTWDADTADATYLYAQTYWTVSPDGLSQICDEARSVPWSSANNVRIYNSEPGYSNAGGEVSASGGLRDMLLNGVNGTIEGMVNSAAWTPLNDTANQYVGVSLDAAFLLDTISNPNARGILLYDASDVAWGNWALNMRESGKGAYITVTMVPEPATMALLALGGLLIARRRQA